MGFSSIEEMTGDDKPGFIANLPENRLTLRLAGP